MPPIEVIPAFRALGIALVLGLLVGVQRQRSQSLVAGVRTFSLVTLLGTCCAILASAAGVGGSAGDGQAEAVGAVIGLGSGAWIIAAGAIGIVGLAVLGNIIAHQQQRADPGMSTEVAMLVMYAVGALAWLAPLQIPAGIGVGVAILLHAKDALHRFTERLGEADVRAILTFALITFIVLPVVPDETYGPFDVLNPHEAWRMVVLVVGISLAGYAATKFFGRSGGSLIAGLMGGLVSSTATTAAAARQSREPRPATRTGAATEGAVEAARARHGLANLAATIVMLATVVMYARVLTEVAVVAPSHLARIAPPIAILGAVTLGLGIWAWATASRNPTAMPEAENPAQLRPAIIFGLLYAAVLFVAAAGQHYLGSGGLFVVAAISGLTDMDAITLSSARLVQDNRLGADDAWRAVLIAATANMAFKTGMVASLGSRALLRRVAAMYGACGVVAIGLVLMWPGSAAAPASPVPDESSAIAGAPAPVAPAAAP